MKSIASNFALCILLFLVPETAEGALCLSSPPPGVIYPGSVFHNQTTDTLFYMSKPRLEILMDREEIGSELIESLREQGAVCDSVIALKTNEAERWYGELIEADKSLEEAELLRAKEKEKASRKKRIWFGIGSVVGFVIGMAL